MSNIGCYAIVLCDTVAEMVSLTSLLIRTESGFQFKEMVTLQLPSVRTEKFARMKRSGMDYYFCSFGLLIIIQVDMQSISVGLVVIPTFYVPLILSYVFPKWALWIVS